ncbi:septum formation initiator family protein [Corynebacterium poyangense]|uniref:Septum formation initiator family protein n=1 Tax=Corynebacterium poyangense TaxID=2684405 RepID=A0A7H0SN05_9CORY|nr:septum formation initiator family protein [Corynebacterium poyangense]MBZ8176229.1 septum formation initiator family protein [Corynebacterium poyangense]QNQ89930.1 septum formation initiator family protein [Corynebacterium poyangense]
MESSNTQTSKSLRGRSTVPVASRDRARERERRSAEAAKQGKKRQRQKQRIGFHPTVIAALVVVVIIMLLLVAKPLENYYQQRNEIARLQTSISAKQQEKAQLEEEIKRYDDPDYVREQARNRLGVIEQGETAFRVLDPRLQRESAGQISQREEESNRTWYSVLWDSVTEPATPEEAQGEPPADDTDTRMPIQPDPAAVPQ